MIVSWLCIMHAKSCTRKITLDRYQLTIKLNRAFSLLSIRCLPFGHLNVELFNC